MIRDATQDVNGVSTSGAQNPRAVIGGNGMTREEFLRRVLYSGEVTKLAQHIALVICILAENNAATASVRDLERITGWTRQAIRDHLTELQGFMKVTLGVGRAKTHFEIQGAIEDAFATAIVSAVAAKHADAKVDAKFVAKEVDAKKESFPPYPPSKKNPSIEREEMGERVFAPAPASRKYNPSPHMNGVGFVISEEHGLFISAEVIDRWRTRFTALPDLEAAMGRLGATVLHRGVTHPGWTCPEGWMAGVLADMNAEAANKRRVADAKITASATGKPSAWKAERDDKLARMRAANRRP